ncbi:trimethylamine methyltransferase family protein [Hoeflea sp. TYP-13]|uniref:trimethylamine methyltransferase family protein n=1 Tax=Hoeflea sp. TYP-13 TaxID=3230023 RepID=UPI0034C6A601
MRRRRAREEKILAVEAAQKVDRSRDIGLVDGALAPYEPLSTGSVDQVVDAALELMRDTGIGFEPDTEALRILEKGGCAVGPEGLVRFPTEIVRDAIRTAARSVKVWNRPGTEFITLDKHHTWFFSGMTCIKVYDEETGEPRYSTRADLAQITRLVDVLPNIDGACVACKIVEQSNIHGEVDEFAVLAEYTSKPLEFLCEYTETLDVVIEMAEVIRGGRGALVKKPYFSHVVTPLPLYYAKTHTDQIIRAAQYGIPLIIGTVTIGGASAPITLAGCLVHALATDLAALVLSQMVRPGSFCLPGSDVAFMEAATGGVGGFSQMYLGDLAICQVMRSLDLPSATGIGGCSSARRFDEDAVWEISSNMLNAFYARPATCDYLGSLDEGITYSSHALVFCDELVGLLRKMWEGIGVDDDMLARDLTREVGARGNYLAHPHTARHCRREYWNARYYGANFPVSSGNLDDETLVERIERDMQEMLDKHVPDQLPDEVLEKIRAIQKRFEAEHPVTG